MTDLSHTIIAKSNQLNADDLLGGKSITIEITAVKLESSEQPVAVCYKGDDGKPWKPCKSMMRVLVNAWGKDGAAFVGRSLTLYRDEKVTWAGLAVGGIRISHMSNISSPLTMALTATKGNKKPYVVKPLIVETVTTKPAPVGLSDDDIAELKESGYEKAREGTEALDAWKKSLNSEQKLALGKEYGAELTKIASDVVGL